MFVASLTNHMSFDLCPIHMLFRLSLCVISSIFFFILVCAVARLSSARLVHVSAPKS